MSRLTDKILDKLLMIDETKIKAFGATFRLCQYHPNHVGTTNCDLCKVVNEFLVLIGEKPRKEPVDD